MNIGEMFISIGVKGGDKSVKELKAVEGAIGGIRESSLAAKAAILGALYGLEQMMAGAMNTGTSVTQFANATGLGVKYIQDLKWAMVDFGVKGEEVEGTLKNLQSRISGMRTNKGTEPLFATFMNATHFDQNKLTDIPYLMQKINEYSKMPDTFDKRMFMNGIGIGDSMVSAFTMNNKRKNPLNFEHLNSSPVGYSESGAAALMQQQAQWEKIWQRFEFGMGKVLAKHGGGSLKAIGDIATQILHVADAFVTLSEKLHVFQGIAHTLEFIASMLGKVTNEGLGEAASRGKTWETMGDHQKRFEKSDWRGKLKDIIFGTGMMQLDDSAVPSQKPLSGDKHSMNTIAPVVNIYTDTSDPKQHGKIAGDELKVAAINMAAILQVS